MALDASHPVITAPARGSWKWDPAAGGLVQVRSADDVRAERAQQIELERRELLRAQREVRR